VIRIEKNWLINGLDKDGDKFLTDIDLTVHHIDTCWLQSYVHLCL